MRVMTRVYSLFKLLVVLAACLTLVAGTVKKFDHQAHAVTGHDKTVKDYDGDGFAEVLLNAELSHSHYFNPKNSSDNGRIVEYRWTDVGTQLVLGKSMKCKHNFPIGETRVTLFVRDQLNDTSTHTMKVTVEPSGAQGAYYYYYDMTGVDLKPYMLSLIDKVETVPKFGTATSEINYYGDKWPVLPKSIQKGPFIVQVISDFLALRDDKYVFVVSIKNGYASLHVDGKQVLWMKNDGYLLQTDKSLPCELKQGKHEIQLRYYSADPTNPTCQVKLLKNGTAEAIPKEHLSYEANRIFPTIHEASTLKSTLGGGGKLYLKGAGFYGHVDVLFGEERGWDINVKSHENIVVTIPSVKQRDDVLLRVKTSKGASNGLPFSYDKAAPMPIKFVEKMVTYPNGTIFPSKQFSSVAIGPDMRYYFGSLDSHVHVAAIKHTDMTVLDYCKSVGLGMGRTVAGVAFNPSDAKVRVYTSTNIFYWRDYYSIPDKVGWHNGKVSTLVQGSTKKGECLVLEKDLITGLPVSNHDHGVNSMIFDNDGNLYIQMGGSTNAGVSKQDDLIGGVKESALSSATIVAHLREPGFNGTITYDRYDDPELAVVQTPKKFIKAYAFGFRNSFGAVFHTSGNIFATDNGPNEGYGNSSVSCTEEGPDPWHPDSLVLVKRGSYFGYPNRARGLKGDLRQCIYFSPEEESKKGFTPALATFEASTNGIIEYTANCFEGQMKGDLLISKYAVQGNGKLYRAQLDATNKALKGPVEEFRELSGLSMVMNPFGAIVMPRVQQPNIAVLYPDEEEVGDKEIRFTAVSPNRGPKKGGNWVILTGKNFGDNLKIFIGGKNCPLVKKDHETRNWAICIVPAGSGSVRVQIQTKDAKLTTKYPDYHYS